uniref:Homeobox domain-containing protein n=1 Tax=Gopherus agassizii TaxID=38772 RepID=A0A452J4Z8_9SAUR
IANWNWSLSPRPAADSVPGRQPSLRPHVHKQTEKTTRVRTVLNEKQLHTLRTCYAANPRPDALMKEQLVEMTGLSPRVIRVWFQNKRCKDKKKSILMKQLTPGLGNAVEVQTYQPPWKALSEFALQSDLDQPAFQQLVRGRSARLGCGSGSLRLLFIYYSQSLITALPPAPWSVTSAKVPSSH